MALAELLSLVEAASIRQTVRSSRSVQRKQTCARLTPALDISALDILNSASDLLMLGAITPAPVCLCARALPSPKPMRERHSFPALGPPKSLKAF